MTILTVAEHRHGDVCGVSYQLLSAGRQLADELDTAVHTAVVGGEIERFGERLDRPGVDVVHTIAEDGVSDRDAAGGACNHDVATQALCQLTAAVDASVVLAPHTVTGLDYAPALASRLGRPLVTDAVAFDTDDGLAVTRGGSEPPRTETVAVDGGRAVVTARPGVWPATEGTGAADVRPFAVDIDADAVHTTVTAVESVERAALDVTEADVVVAVGRGIGSADNLDLVFDLASTLGGTVAASAPVVKRGWLPADRLIGHSGVSVSPDVYLAIGISGATQHLSGMADSDTVVAINNDPGAPIFDVADYGVVADLFDVVPALTDNFRKYSY